MITINVRGLDGVQKSLSRFSAEIQGLVLRPAINKTADKAKAQINRAIPQEFAVKASEVRNAIEISKAQGANVRAVITIFGSARKRGRSLNLIHFLAAVQALGKAVKTRGSKAKKKELASLENQLGFLIKKGGGLKKIKGAFLGNNGRTIFRRVPGTVMGSRSKYGGTKHAEGIEALQVIGFSQMFNSRRINSQVMATIDRELPVEVDRSIKMLLARNGL